MIESSGDAQVMQPYAYNLTCTLSCSSTNHTSLTWEDSSGDILESTNGSNLLLYFPDLFLSNISIYTCKVNYNNEVSNKITKEIIAEGNYIIHKYV